MHNKATVEVADREASSDADVASWLVSGYPYVCFAPLDELAVWLALGIGYGEMELDDTPRPLRPELAMYLAAAGIDSKLLSLQHFRLGLRMGGADSAATAAPLEVYVGRDAATQDAAEPKYHFGLNASIRA